MNANGKPINSAAEERISDPDDSSSYGSTPVAGAAAGANLIVTPSLTNRSVVAGGVAILRGSALA
jgi:hypothetical protein